MAALSNSLATTPSLLLKPKLPIFRATQFEFPALTLSTHSLSSEKAISFQTTPRIRSSKAASVDSPATADAAGEIVSATADSSGDGVSTIISVLLFTAFIGLSILTIGVIYLGVTDFLQKREREKLEKEEASRKKRGKKKSRVRTRAGPRGFGQKIEEDDDFQLFND